MRDVLGVLAQIPLQMTGEARAIIEYAEQHRARPLPARGEYLTRADMTVPVIQAPDVLGLVAAHFARRQARLGALCASRAPRAQARSPAKALGVEEATQRRVGGHRLQRRLRLRECAQIVVVQLHRPARMRGVLFAQRLADRKRQVLRAGIGAHLASKHSDRIAPLTAGAMQPALDSG